MSKKQVGKMTIRIKANDDFKEFVELNWGRIPAGYIELCRKEVRCLFPGMLPKHGTEEKVWVELTARRVKK